MPDLIRAATGIYDHLHEGTGRAIAYAEPDDRGRFRPVSPEHTCDGDNISPRIRVSGSDAPYLAVIMDDRTTPPARSPTGLPGTSLRPARSDGYGETMATYGRKKHLRSRLRPREGPESRIFSSGERSGQAQADTTSSMPCGSTPSSSVRPPLSTPMTAQTFFTFRIR